MNKEEGSLITKLMEEKYEIVNHYLSGQRYYVHFRYKTDEMLRYACFLAEASNNPLQIWSDDPGFGLTLIIHHNCDILLYHLREKNEAAV